MPLSLILAMYQSVCTLQDTYNGLSTYSNTAITYPIKPLTDKVSLERSVKVVRSIFLNLCNLELILRSNSSCVASEVKFRLFTLSGASLFY
jgi:hypothetical protein